MSYTDSGLGWYANSEWMTDEQGVIAELSNGAIPLTGFVKLNIRAAVPPILTTDTYYGTWDGHMQYCMTTEDDTYIFYVASQPYPGIGVASIGHPATVYFGYPDGYAYTWRQGSINAAYSPVGSSNTIYYDVGYANNGPTNLPIDYIWPTVQEALDALAGRIGIYNKSANGYSVVCCCKWITSYGGDVYFSPVLISSQQNNTLYTRNGSTPSVNTTEHQHQGMTFYMRKAPLDTLDGTEIITSNYPVVDLSGVAQTNDSIFAAIAYQSELTAGPFPQDEDPYAGGGTSGPSGGDGTFDNTSDQIVDSTTPVFSFADSGFCRIYNPTLTQLQSLANYLWTDNTFLQTVINHAKQLLEDPIEAIISVAMLPVAIPQGSSENVKVLFINTGVSMAPATTQYVEVDCGTFTLQEYYGSALDYNPYTQVDLFLPFIGQVSLNTDEVMGKTLSIKYRVDIVSGMCVAKVFANDNCLYQFSGNCAIFMPLNSADFSSYLSAAITAATALVSAGAGAAAGSAAAAAESIAEPAVQTGGNLLSSGESLITPQMAAEYRANEFILGRTSGGHSLGEMPPASFGEMERKLIGNTVLAVLGSKISFEHASHLAGNSGILGIRRPYLIINRPDMCNPDQYGKYNGRPCMMYLSLGSLRGYTEIQEIQLTGFSATNPELAEISKMLKGGVIL